MKSAGEEYECATFLDGLHEVKYWVRNLAKRPTSFSLQTSTDRFYPDFVCLLNDGRVLVAEYKGKDRWDGIDATEKRAVGTVWEGRSNGKCLFVMPEGKDLAAIPKKFGAGPRLDSGRKQAKFDTEAMAGIQKTAEVCGGEARIAGTRIPVWVLVQARQLGMSDAVILQNYPSLTAENLQHAWTYAEEHQAEIDNDIRSNEEA